jgi:hypothetical protein
MKCPVCRVDNEQGPSCRRCRADLSLLFALEEQRERAKAVTVHHLKRGQYQKALAEAERLRRLGQDGETQLLLAVASLLTRNFSRALDHYHRARAALTES